MTSTHGTCSVTPGSLFATVDRCRRQVALPRAMPASRFSRMKMARYRPSGFVGAATTITPQSARRNLSQSSPIGNREFPVGTIRIMIRQVSWNGEGGGGGGGLLFRLDQKYYHCMSSAVFSGGGRPGGGGGGGEGGLLLAVPTGSWLALID